MVVLENTTLRITALPARGGDLVEFLHKPTGVDFMWKAPGHAERRRAPLGAATPFLDQYLGGWHEMLPNFGPGHLHGAEFGLCGEATLLPWTATVENDDRDGTSVLMEVRLGRLPLVLGKRLRLRGTEPTLFIEESVHNLGPQPIDFTWGHHPAIGGAFLGPSCAIETPGGPVLATGPGGVNAPVAPGSEGIWPQIERADGCTLDLSQVRPYEPGWEEDFCLTNVREPWVGVTEQSSGLGFGLAWELDVFPHLWIWQNFGGRLDYPWYGRTYCLGLEPLSSFPFDIEAAVAAGTQLTLEPEEKKETRLCATVYRCHGALRGIDIDGSVDIDAEPKTDGRIDA